MVILTTTISHRDEERTGLKPGQYVIHLSDDGRVGSLMFRPEFASTFRAGVALDEDK